MSSIARDRGLELDLWLAGIFTAAELAAADLLLRLSGEDAAPTASTSTTPSSSPRRKEFEEERVVDEPAVSMELDRRARKRYRLLSDLYAATSQVTSTAAPAAKKRKMRDHDDDDEGGESDSSSSEEEATR